MKSRRQQVPIRWSDTIELQDLSTIPNRTKYLPGVRPSTHVFRSMSGWLGTNRSRTVHKGCVSPCRYKPISTSCSSAFSSIPIWMRTDCLKLPFRRTTGPLCPLTKRFITGAGADFWHTGTSYVPSSQVTVSVRRAFHVREGR